MPSKQAPIDSEFGARSTAAEILDGANLTGEIAIVTGGSSGIGLETTRALTRAGMTVIVAARDPEKARRDLASIRSAEVAKLDLMDPASIDSFGAAFLESGRPLNLLINNAGIIAAPLRRDARGYESHFSANHLGHFHLTMRLWPALKQAGGSRVGTLSSGAHRQAAVDFDDPNFERRPYDKWKAYGQSKTANALFTVALDRRGQPHDIRAFAVHPGRIETKLQRFITLEELQARGFRDEMGKIPAMQRGLYKTPEQGAATTVWCAVSPTLHGMGGVYCENCNIAQAVPEDHKPLNDVLPWAIDEAASERLWTLSERMTGPR